MYSNCIIRIEELAVRGCASAMMIAIQQAPRWLRPLLLILPASRLLPIDKTVSGGSKRKRSNVLDSSNDGNGGNRGGYGSQYRSRQLRFLFVLFVSKIQIQRPEIRGAFLSHYSSNCRDYFKLVQDITLETARRDGRGSILYASQYFSCRDIMMLRPE
jgi:hypothetical protein